MVMDKDIMLIDGTIVAIAGDDFAVIAADTQLTKDDLIGSSRRDQLFQLSPVAVMSSAGSWPDTLALVRLLETAVRDYKSTIRRPITIDVVSRLLSKTMCQRRFLPYSVSTILAGIDNEGKGAVFSLDSYGNSERMNYQATGAATAMVLPLLDSRLGFKNQSETLPTEKIEVTEAVSLISKCMITASEFGKYSGDYGLMKIISKDGIKVRELPLRQK